MSERRNTSNDRRLNDRRRTQRSPIDCEIRLLSKAAPSQVLQASLQNVSASGLRLVGQHEIAIGEKLLIEARRDSRVVCNVTVQVVWSESGPDGHFVMGCESLADFTPRQLSELKSVAAEADTVAAPE